MKYVLQMLLALSLLGTIASRSSADEASVVQRGKRATALVQITGAKGKGFGTAFCIDPRGYFITNKHVTTQAVAAGTLQLVLNCGDLDQKTYSGKVIREGDSEDLAIIQAVPEKGAEVKFATLDLGLGTALVETQPLTAFGYPFGDLLATSGEEYPAISVSTGRITSLRKSKGNLQLIQLDASLNPGNSGGPVLDDQGRVVGIVQAGIRGAALNFAIPVDRLKKLIDRPDIDFDPSPVAADKSRKPQDFTAHVVSFGSSVPDYAIELVLRDPSAAGDRAERRFPMQRAERGTYRVTAPLLPTESATRHFHLDVHYSAGSMSFGTPDAALTVGGKTFKWSGLSRIELGSNSGAVLKNGERVSGRVAGLEAIEANFGEFSHTLNLTKAVTIEIADPPGDPQEVAFTVSVKLGTEVVGEKEGSIIIDSVGDSHSRGSAASTTPRINSGLVGLGAVREAPLAEDKVTVKLPAPIDDVVAGGGGRLLLFYLKKLQQIAIFDVNQAKIVKYVHLTSDNVCYAAGAGRMIVAAPDQGVLQRWNLRMFEKDLTVALPTASNVQALAMGWASAGPALMYDGSSISFIDPETLRPADIKLAPSTNVPWWSGQRLNVRASGDGTCFAAWSLSGSPSGIRTMTLEGKAAVPRYQHDSAGALLPSMDGSLLFTAMGVLDVDLKPLAGESFQNVACVPSYHPAYFIAVANFRAYQRSIGQPQAKSTLSIYAAADRKLLFSIPADEDFGMNPYVRVPIQGQTLLGYEKRLHFFPSANLLVTVSSSRDELRLERLRILDELNKSGIDYLYVDSLPVMSISPGSTYSYAIQVKSKRGGVKLSLDSGPDGMTLSPEGRISWHVPPSLKEVEVPVIVSVKDASDQEIYHSFKLHNSAVAPNPGPQPPGPRGRR